MLSEVKHLAMSRERPEILHFAQNDRHNIDRWTDQQLELRMMFRRQSSARNIMTSNTT